MKKCPAFSSRPVASYHYIQTLLLVTTQQVGFERGVNFTGNGAGSGAAIAVGTEGSVTVDDFSFFLSNTADSGQGGAILNLGNLTFGRASYFRFNEATGEMRTNSSSACRIKRMVQLIMKPLCVLKSKQIGMIKVQWKPFISWGTWTGFGTRF